MKIFKQQEWEGGWFIGDFDLAAYRTKDFEVCYKIHPKGEEWPEHYHKVAIEINLLIKGRMSIGDDVFEAGDTFLVEPNESIKPYFLEDCELIVVKTPSLPYDKYITNK
jgi:mannose-6-phosphate isomerase-like protein (cupin superfamily)